MNANNNRIKIDKTDGFWIQNEIQIILYDDRTFEKCILARYEIGPLHQLNINQTTHQTTWSTMKKKIHINIIIISFLRFADHDIYAHNRCYKCSIGTLSHNYHFHVFAFYLFIFAFNGMADITDGIPFIIWNCFQFFFFLSLNGRLFIIKIYIVLRWHDKEENKTKKKKQITNNDRKSFSLFTFPLFKRTITLSNRQFHFTSHVICGQLILSFHFYWLSKKRRRKKKRNSKLASLHSIENCFFFMANK